MAGREQAASMSSSACPLMFDIERQAASRIYSQVYDWQTRVLVLQAARFGEPLVAELHVVDLLHGPGLVLNTGQRRRIEYTALSYCWGGQHFSKEIECNGTLYPITENLFDALQHMRDREETAAFWVNAVCTCN